LTLKLQEATQRRVARISPTDFQTRTKRGGPMSRAAKAGAADFVLVHAGKSWARPRLEDASHEKSADSQNFEFDSRGQAGAGFSARSQ
jgi:hypothetical protein